VLEFELEEIDGKTRLTATAYWHPAGVWGLLYWYSLVPLHVILFEGMTKAIARRAELCAASRTRQVPVAERVLDP